MHETSATVAASQTRSSARILREAGLVLALGALTALGAKVAIPLPWTPVPVTLQVLAVVFAGAAFGARRGLYSQLAYLGAGLCGLPVFASWTLAGPAAVLSPTFGYLLSFPLAAWLAGCGRTRRGHWLFALAALGAVYLLGVLWLIGWTSFGGAGLELGPVLVAGLLPFLPLDAVKVALAVLTAEPLRQRIVQRPA